MEKELSLVLKEISQLLQKQKVSVAVAESCTAGLIQHHLSHAEEAMNFFQGGITVYNIGQKAKHLNINPIAAEACNAVAPEIAEKWRWKSGSYLMPNSACRSPVLRNLSP